MRSGWRRWLRRGLLTLPWLLAGCVTATALRAPVSLPFDFVCNLASAVEDPALSTALDGKVRVVFCQHGLWRTPMSLDRLERSLAVHGYEVINVGYPSTEDFLAGHAARLRDAVEARARRGAIDEIAFIGHSMGGLVIQEYLRMSDARPPHRCVYLASPHRGAILADKRRHWFGFQFAMGDRAALQLLTTDPQHRKPIPFGDRSGTVVGDVGPGNRSIPGNDDGTVGVDEATFAGAADSVTVPYGHTSITVRERVIRQVLHFLQAGHFDHGA